MPTINKNSDDHSLDGIRELMLTLPGFEDGGTGTDNDNKKWNLISVDGEKNVFFGLYTAQYARWVGVLKKGSGDVYDVLAYIELVTGTGDNTYISWLRCYTSSSSQNDRLITSAVSQESGSILQNLIHLCVMTGKDTSGNTVYGIGSDRMEIIYCLETNIVTNLSFRTNSKGAIPSHLTDKAIMCKAVNLSHPDLIEMQNFYTSLLRPTSINMTEGAQRFLISSALWGFAGTDFQPSNNSYLFDPALKI